MKLTRTYFFIYSFSLLCLLVSNVISAPGPQILLNAHQGTGYIEPILSPFYTDNVAWSTVSIAGKAFGRANGGIIGEYYYLFGMMGNPLAQVYNWETEHWQLSSTQPPYGDCNWAGVSTGESIYLIGRYCDFSFGNEVQKFTPIGSGPSGIWTTVAEYPISCAGIAAAWDGGDYIYACGGSDLIHTFNSAYRYDITADVWEEITPLPIPMTYHGGAFVGGKFHVMGGVQSPSNAHYCYDPETDIWTAKSPMPTANTFALFNLTANADYIISVGGGGGYSIWPGLSAVQLYFPDTDSWLQESPLPAARGMNSAIWTPHGEVLSGGGYVDYFFSQIMYKGVGFPSSGAMAVENQSLNTNECLTVLPPSPNPFNTETDISFVLIENTVLEINIYNISGGLVKKYSSSNYSAGENHLRFSAENLASGLYFVVFTGNIASFTEKILYLK